jgi:hypothetical protein
LLTINTAIRREVMQLQHFTEGNVPVGLVNSPENWNPQQILQWQEWFDSLLAGNTAAKTRLLWGPAGAKYQPFREPPYKDTFDDWLARKICFAFSLPPTAFVPQMNRATASSAQEVALEEGLAPLMRWVKRLCDNVIQGRLEQKDLEFAWEEKKSVDQAEQATILSTYVKDGIQTINEARDVLGLDPVEGGDDAMVQLASGPVLLRDIEQLSTMTVNPPEPTPPAGNVGEGGVPGKGPAPNGKAPTRARGNGKSPANSGPTDGKEQPQNSARRQSREARAQKAIESIGPTITPDKPPHNVDDEMPTLAQDAADYVPHPVDGEQCDGCTMFRPLGRCTLVEGPISPSGHCQYWDAKEGLAAEKAARPFRAPGRNHALIEATQAALRRKLRAFFAERARDVAAQLAREMRL